MQRPSNVNVGQGLAPAARQMIRLYRDFRRIRNFFRADDGPGHPLLPLWGNSPCIRPYGQTRQSLQHSCLCGCRGDHWSPGRNCCVYNGTSGEFATYTRATNDRPYIRLRDVTRCLVHQAGAYPPERPAKMPAVRIHCTSPLSPKKSHRFP